MNLRITMTTLAVAGALFAGCGDDESNEATTTPEQAIAEIGEVRAGLEEAVTTYESGDVAAADEQVGDAYLEHFELVEGPLEEVDAELNEELEDSIREELRAEIKAEAPAEQIRALVDDINAGLDEAETALR